MVRKKKNITILIIVIVSIIIVGGVLTWGFLTNWGQGKKSEPGTKSEPVKYTVPKKIPKGPTNIIPQIRPIELPIILPLPPPNFFAPKTGIK